ncbi:MAG TPA: RIP metalloprotease RseP [Clostridiales bacterium]|nr:RIP metalloprotease RseP [Clostridiales bacterium]
MNILVAILVVGIIIIIHELGHFLLAKKNGITVTEFSVGLGPRIASFVKGGTRYSLKIFPFGGSCMMLGEDETVEDEGAFHKKGVWARFSVIFAGAFFNFVLAFILALIVVGAEGIDLPQVVKVRGNSPAEGKLMEGDMIKKINGKSIHLLREMDMEFYFNPIQEGVPIEVTYERDGKIGTTSIVPAKLETYLLGCNYEPGLGKATLVAVTEDFPLAESGLMIGDTIVEINGVTVKSGDDLSNYLNQFPLTGEPVSLKYERDGEIKEVTVTPKLYASGIGIGWGFSYQDLSPLEVIKYSYHEVKFNITSTIKSIGFLIRGKLGLDDLAGPVGIVNYVGQVVDGSKEYGLKVIVLNLMQFSIMISANLGVINLLPIPAMDGGRLVFLLIEAIRRKPVPKEKEAMVHLVGMAALMVLMVFVLFNDIRNIFG